MFCYLLFLICMKIKKNKRSRSTKDTFLLHNSVLIKELMSIFSVLLSLRLSYAHSYFVSKAINF